MSDRRTSKVSEPVLVTASITFVPTASGFLYLAVVLDAWSRKIVGWSMAMKLKLPRFRGVVLDLGDYGSVVTASIAAS